MNQCLEFEADALNAVSALQVPLQVWTADRQDQRHQPALAKRNSEAASCLSQGFELHHTRSGQVAPGILQMEADA